MIKSFSRFILSLLMTVAFVFQAFAATLLPNGEQTFFDSNGNPLASGFVYFYVPNTTQLKATWKNSGQTIQNTNPVRLDAGGRAIIYGTGAYRQIVKDVNGNTIWDQITTDTASDQNSWGGITTGSANTQVAVAANFSSNSGQQVTFIAGYTNTGATTLNVGGGPISILKNTNAGPVGLVGGEIFTGNVYIVVYNAGAFHLVNQP